MKKILYLIPTLLIMQLTFAQEEINYAEILNSTSMPSDEEISKVINQFNFPQDQKEQLFKETKKQLQELYQTKDSKLLEQKAIEGAKLLNQTELSPQNFD